MLFFLTAASARTCGPGEGDTSVHLARADRVYRGRVVELRDCRERSRCEVVEEVPAWGGQDSVAVLEIVDVWKGAVTRRVELALEDAPALWVGWTGVIFQQGRSLTGAGDACGWSGTAAELGPARAHREVEPTVEDLLWQAVAADDLDAVDNALAAGPRLDRRLPAEEDLLRSCPPLSYDELVRAGLRSVGELARCPNERLLPLLEVVPAGDPGWADVAVRADVPLLDELERHGVPLGPLFTRAIYTTKDRLPERIWWMDRGMDLYPWSAFSREEMLQLAVAGYAPECDEE